jgi:hypothetical protein
MSTIPPVDDSEFEDDRWRRLHKVNTHRVWIFLVAAISVIGGLIGIFSSTIDIGKTFGIVPADNTPPTLHVVHYRHLIWRWGLPEGIGQLVEASRAHLETNYRVVIRGGKVIEVRRENRAGLAPR